MKTYTIAQIKGILNEANYKYVGLFNQEGKQIIPFNSNRTTSAQRQDEIYKRLNSAGIKDGFYVIKGKNSLAGGTVPDEFTVIKGKPDNEVPALSEKPPVEIMVKSPDVLSYDEALKLSVECERLKLENKSKDDEIARLKIQIAELEEESDSLGEADPNAELLDNAKSFLGNIMEFAAPLLDKHFDLREKALGVRAMELEYRRNRTPENKPTKHQDPTQKQPNYIQAFIMSYAEDPEVYEDLANLYNTSTDEQNFMNQLKEYNEEICNALINGGRK